MFSDDERLSREQLAASVEWGLNPPQPGGEFEGRSSLESEAAAHAVSFMVGQYEWLEEWAKLAREAALAAVAFDVAEVSGAPKSLKGHLAQAASVSRSKLELFNLDHDIAIEILETLAALQRIAAKRPPGYEAR
jgi:hypothetical protein